MKRIFIILMGIIILPACVFCQNKKKPVKFELIEVARSDLLWTGVAVSKECRIFVNYPRWSEGVVNSVAEITKSGEVKPFPDREWNKWDANLSPKEHFVCVQSVFIDTDNYLWILDPASPLLAGVVENGAKLIKIDLSTDKLVQKIYFDSSIAPKSSYLNDIRVDTETGFAYISDSGIGAVIVVNTKTGISRRLLSKHPSTQAENITFTVEGIKLPIKVHSDGIALDTKRGYMYYQPLTGRKLYRIKTEYLHDKALSEFNLGKKVELVGNSGVSDGIAYYKDGNIYLTSIEHNSIRRISPEGKVEQVIQDSRLKWPDSFSITPDGSIYVTISQLHLGNSITEPYKIFRLKPQN